MGVALLSTNAGADHSVVELASFNPRVGNDSFDASYEGSSADGTKVYFSTEESMVGADRDGNCPDDLGAPVLPCRDVYQYSAGSTTLISRDPRSLGRGNGPFGASFDAASADGSRIFFSTRESLLPSDTDPATECDDVLGNPAPCRDIYEYQPLSRVLTLISTETSPDPGDAEDVTFGGISRNGSRVFFTTSESLHPADRDRDDDLYMRAGGATTLISRGDPGMFNGDFDADFAGTAVNGSRVFFATRESLVASDQDPPEACDPDDPPTVPPLPDCRDIYERTVTGPPSGRVTRLVSTGPAGGDGPFDAQFQGMSEDGSRVFFETDEALVGGDQDQTAGCESGTPPVVIPCRDVYQWSGGTTTLVSRGGNGPFEASFEGASPDGSRVYFRTREPLDPTDVDPEGRDIYERSGGATTLISTGPAGGDGDFDASFEAVSGDGSRVFFSTSERLLGADGDGGCKAALDDPGGPCRDVYQYRDGLTTLISARGDGPFDASFEAATQDGSRVFFSTRESLLSEDQDPADGCTDSLDLPSPCRDVYEREGFTISLISRGPAGGDGPFDASFEAATQDGERVFLTTREALLAGDTDGDCTDSLGNPTLCEDVYVLRSGADLALSQTDSADPAILGETVTYTLAVENHGSLDATEVNLTDTLPAGARFDSAAPSQGSCSQSAGTVTCGLGELANGDTATVNIRVTPEGTGTFTNFATVEASQGDPSDANNSASESTTVVPPPPPPPPPGPPQGTGGGPSAAAPPPQPAPRVVARDTVAPVVSLSSRSRHKLKTVLSKGVKVTLKCLEACKVDLTLELDRQTARRLKLSAQKGVVGRTSATLTADRSRRVTVKISSRAKRRLRRSRKIELRLRASASDTAGNVRRGSKKLTFRR